MTRFLWGSDRPHGVSLNIDTAVDAFDRVPGRRVRTDLPCHCHTPYRTLVLSSPQFSVVNGKTRHANTPMKHWQERTSPSWLLHGRMHHICAYTHTKHNILTSGQNLRLSEATRP